MKKIIFLIAGIFMLASCGHTPGDRQKIEEQIIAYQKQVTEINKKILDLQKQLDAIRLKEKNNRAGGLKYKVKTEKVTRRIFRHYFEASGDVQAVSEAFVSPEVNGQVKKVFVVEGKRVKKGQLLARLETDMIENSIKEVETSLELARITYKKQKDLWDKKIGSEIQYLQAKNRKDALERKLETLKTQYEKSFIRAPLDGYVEEVNLKEGELAAPGIRFFHVVNLDKMYINADLSEAYLPVINEGDTVEVRFAAYPDIVLHEPIFRVGNVVNKQSRTFKIQLKVNNPQNKLKPNLLATLKINDYTNPSAIVVPSVLLKEDISGYYLYVLQHKEGVDVAAKRYVTIGHSFDDKTEIVSGLSESDVYITDGYNNVSDGTLVEVE